MKIQTVFAKNMKKYRKEAKLTQEKLAEICGTDHRYIGQIETGNRCPSLEYVERIANALKIEPYLLFFEGNNNENEGFLSLNTEQKQQLKSMLLENYLKICTAIDRST